MVQDSRLADFTDFRTEGNKNAASTIQNGRVENPTCRTEDRASLETNKCVSASPPIWSAL